MSPDRVWCNAITIEALSADRTLHYIIFTCYHRLKHLDSAAARDVFEQTLERVRRWYRFQVVGYVVMPEHVHLLMSEPERSNLATALQVLKRRSSSRIRKHAGCSRRVAKTLL